MVTGDNKLTAIAIARECGILGEEMITDGCIMEGPEFYEKLGGLICKNVGCGMDSTQC